MSTTTLARTGRTKQERRTLALELIDEATHLLDHEHARELLTGYTTECRNTRNAAGDTLLATRLYTVATAYEERPWALRNPARFGLLIGQAIGLLA